MTQSSNDLFVMLQAEGWRPLGLTDFSCHLAPCFFRIADNCLSIGFVAGPDHCNGHLGTVHGGALMTFADIAGGTAVARVLGHERCATVQLQTHFTAAGRRGEFLQCEPEIVRQTRDLIFLRGMVRSAERNVLGFDGIWKILAER